MKLKFFIKRVFEALIVLFVFLPLIACSKKGQKPSNNSRSVDFSSLDFSESYDFQYAGEIDVKKSGNFKLITISGKDRFLLVPQNEEIPLNIPKKTTVLKQPLDNTYLISTASMDLIAKAEAISSIKYACLKEKDWFIPEAQMAFQNGTMTFAGKYSAPDFELLTANGCNFTIANTMIFHKPEIKEKLEELSIPVLIDRSVYESNPLGKFEWIKLYGILFNTEEKACSYFENELLKIKPVLNQKPAELTVAFFFVNSNGIVNVRKPKDYIVKMIEMAGGKYIFSQLPGQDENSLSTMNMQMEDFYTAAINADILIYNSTIDGKLNSVSQLLNKSELFADFKAVKNGHLYCTENNFFQCSTGIGAFIKDIHNILTNGGEPLKFLERIDN